MSESNQNTIKLPACLLRAAAIFRAKGDVRYYLNGIHINPAGYIEASDGHTGFRAECEEAKALSEPLILEINGDIPKSAYTAELVRLAGGEGYLRLFRADDRPVESKGFPVRRWVRLVTDGVFPDLGAVMDKHKPEPASRVQFNTSYLVRLDKAATAMGSHYPAATFDLSGENGPAAATINAHGHTAHVLVMGMRL